MFTFVELIVIESRFSCFSKRARRLELAASRLSDTCASFIKDLHAVPEEARVPLRGRQTSRASVERAILAVSSSGASRCVFSARRRTIVPRTRFHSRPIKWSSSRLVNSDAGEKRARRSESVAKCSSRGNEISSCDSARYIKA